MHLEQYLAYLMLPIIVVFINIIIFIIISHELQSSLDCLCNVSSPKKFLMQL